MKGHVNIVDCLGKAMRPDGSMGGNPVVDQADEATAGLSVGLFSGRAAEQAPEAFDRDAGPVGNRTPG